MNTLHEVYSLVKEDAIWIALKSDDQVHYERLLDNRVVFLHDKLIAIAGADWNTTLSVAKLFHKHFVGEIRIGSFLEVYKKGWVCTPCRGYIDFHTNPIVIQKT